MDNLTAILLRTADFAASKHVDQRRKDSKATPYINHPIGVTNILANEAGIEDIAVLQAALLHDTVEDTKTTLEELRLNFGDKVASIVAEVTDDKSLSKDERKRLQVEHAKHASREAKLVKLADKLHNLRDLVNNPPPDWTPERVQGYFVWSREVVNACKGTNEALEAHLNALFEKVIKNDQTLDQYYASMKVSKD